MLRVAGVRGKRGSALGKQAVANILRNPVYAARLRTSLVQGERRGNWEPIVPAELFDRVQRILAGGVQAGVAHTQTRPEFVLKGFLLCEKCGRKLTASWSRGKLGRKYPYYHCPHCSSGQSLRMDTMHEEFEAILGRMRLSEESSQHFVTAAKSYVEGAAKAAAAERKARAETSMKLNREEERLLDLLLKGTISDEAYKKRLDEVRTERSAMDAGVSAVHREFLDFNATLEYTRRVLLEPVYFWRNSNDSTKMAFQQFWFPGGLTFDKSRPVGTRIKPITAEGCTPAATGLTNLVEPIRPISEKLIEFLHFCERLRLSVA